MIVMQCDEDYELEILETCRDYYSLANSLEQDFLKDMENKLQHYQNYIVKHNNIDDYKKEFGNHDIVDWFEGLMSTKDFIEQYKNNDLFNFEDTKECIKILKKFQREVNKLDLNAEEKFEYILKKYEGSIEFKEEGVNEYTIELYQNYNEGSVLATFNIDIKTDEVKLSKKFDIFNNKNDLFLTDYSVSDINKNIERGNVYGL